MYLLEAREIWFYTTHEEIETDEGIYGLGDATLNGREMSVASYLTDHIIPCLIGRDPFQTEDIWHYLYRGAYWRRGPVTMAAIGAVDVALHPRVDNIVDLEKLRWTHQITFRRCHSKDPSTLASCPRNTR